jgi:hypothetical protein
MSLTDNNIIDLTLDDDDDEVHHDYRLRPRKATQKPKAKPKQRNPRRVFDTVALQEEIEKPVKVPDYQLKPLRKFERPYFSPYFDSYEMDYVNTGKFFDNRNRTRVQNYLFVININTKYLISIPLPKGAAPSVERTMEALTQVFQQLSPNTIESLRGDADTAFGSLDATTSHLNLQTQRRKHNLFYNFLRENGVKRLYLSSSKFINKNRCVDRVIRTIRDMIGMKTIKLLNPLTVQHLVEIYNNSPHSAYFHNFSPKQVQDDLEIEAAYIRYQMENLNEINSQLKKEGFQKYKPGNILLIHIPLEKTDLKFDKRRRNFSDLATFKNYKNGNVVCELLNKSYFRNPVIELPIHYTKFLSNDYHTIPATYKEAFIITPLVS